MWDGMHTHVSCGNGIDDDDHNHMNTSPNASFHILLTTNYYHHSISILVSFAFYGKVMDGGSSNTQLNFKYKLINFFLSNISGIL